MNLDLLAGEPVVDRAVLLFGSQMVGVEKVDAVGQGSSRAVPGLATGLFAALRRITSR
ncbi:hypothetical protein [Dechloromonas sp. A34]|uniref:hypothetical protein n=1 Tax=Dechloromonas sp. A34 TaxID=447588 RepID=UPI0022497BDD|nr:hypothetical protein [Dechloromonas sp. A34]